LSTVVLAAIVGSVFVVVGYDVGAMMALPGSVKTALTFLFYVLSYYFIIFMNTALVGTVLLMMEGKQPQLADGFRMAWRRKGVILGYAVVVATIGMLFRYIFRRLGWLSGVVNPIVQRMLVFTVIGVAWHVVPYLIVPILIVEHLGPWQAVQRGSQLIKQAWGEDIIMYASAWLILALPVILAAVIGIPMIGWAMSTLDPVTITLTVFAVSMVVLTLFILNMALDGVFSAVVYRYAADKTWIPPFDERLLGHAFRSRPSRMADWFRHIGSRWDKVRG
jgi:hypothetical protein